MVLYEICIGVCDLRRWRTTQNSSRRPQPTPTKPPTTTDNARPRYTHTDNSQSVCSRLYNVPSLAVTWPLRRVHTSRQMNSQLNCCFQHVHNCSWISSAVEPLQGFCHGGQGVYSPPSR